MAYIIPTLGPWDTWDTRFQSQAYETGPTNHARHWKFIEIRGDPQVTSNIYCKSCNPSQYRYAKIPHRFAVTSGSPSSCTGLKHE